MARDPLIEMKRHLRPGERLPRWAEDQAREYQEQSRPEVTEKARAAEDHENEAARLARYDAVTEGWEERALADHMRAVERKRRKP